MNLELNKVKELARKHCSTKIPSEWTFALSPEQIVSLIEEAVALEADAACPTCGAPCSTHVQWGWGTSDRERTTYTFTLNKGTDRGNI